MIDDRGYWNSFYEKNGVIHTPSSFASHIQDTYLEDGKALLELGCGNGRDAVFFAEKGAIVSALDLSSQTIQTLSSMNIKNTQFFNQDFSQISDFSNFDYVYSRFTLHSVDAETEMSVFQQLPKVLRKGGLFLMEARSLKDESMEKAFGVAHFRRYLNFEESVRRIEDLNFRILEKTESQGLSPYKDEDPFLIRIIAEKI